MLLIAHGDRYRHVVAGHADFCCQRVGLSEGGPSEGCAGWVGDDTDLFLRNSCCFFDIRQVCADCHGFAVNAENAVRIEVSLDRIGFDLAVRLSLGIEASFYDIRRLVKERIDIVTCSLDGRLDAPHVRVIVVDADRVRLDCVQVVSVFRKLLVFKGDLGCSFSRMLFRVGNCDCDAVTVVHDFIFCYNIVGFLGCQSSR